MKVTWRDGLESGDVVVVGQGGAAPHPDLPKVPMMQDLARTPEERQLIEAGITIPNQITRPFALPPGVPEERVQAVRQAFQATLRDPNFLADAEKAKLEVQPGTAEDIQSGIDRIKRLSPEIKKQLKTILYPQ